VRSPLPRRFRRNVVINYLNVAVAAIVALVMTPVLARGLGKEGYGIWVLVASFSLYVDLFEIGFGSSTIRWVAYYFSLGEKIRLLRTICTSFWLLTIPGIAGLGIGALLTVFFPTIFGVEDRADEARLLVAMMATGLAISIPGDTFGNVLAGLQNYFLLDLTIMSVRVAQAISWALVLWAGGGLVALGAVTVALGVAGQVARFLIARHLLGGIPMSPRNFDRGLVRPLASLSGWLAMSQTAGVVLNRIDTVVVGLVVGVPAAGVYAVGQKLAFAMEKLIRPSTLGFFPHSAELAAREDAAGLREAMVTGTRLSLAIAGPITITLIMLADPAIRTWVGPSFGEAAQVVIYLAAAQAAAAVARTGVGILQGSGRPKIPAFVSSFEAALNLGLSIALGLRMGLTGVALATLIAAVTTRLGIYVPYLTRQFGVGFFSFIALIARAHALPTLSAVTVGLLIPRGDISNIAELLAAAAVIAGTYVGVFLLTGLNGRERRIVFAFMLGRRWAGMA
jgi:O-antigen/teichoic acid export membrane protein